MSAVAPRLFRLERAEDESGVSGTGHVADGVAWHDGTCTVHWRTEHTSTTVYRDFTTVLAIHGHGGKTIAVFAEHPYDRGASEAAQDAMENAPCASIGGLDARVAPRVPAYVPEAHRAAWLSGYSDACATVWGADWRMCAFGWRAAVTVGGEDREADSESNEKGANGAEGADIEAALLAATRAALAQHRAKRGVR